jgi:hypothetical protein
MNMPMQGLPRNIAFKLHPEQDIAVGGVVEDGEGC